MSKDLQGRAYATVAEVKAGTILQADGDFDCLGKGANVTVFTGDGGVLCFECAAGHHKLEGQLSDDGTYYVGLYPSNPLIQKID